MKIISWEIPLKTVSEANVFEHWTKKSKRHRQQQYFTNLSFKTHIKPGMLLFPLEVSLIRLAPRSLDEEDNLRFSLKYVKDEIGACLFPEKVVHYKSKDGKFRQNKGHADSDPRVTWKYGQEKAKRMGVRIIIQF